MAGYHTVTTFFDESGKFKDHKVVSFGGVAAYNEHFVPFADEWGRLLYRNGMDVFKVNRAFKHHVPLGSKNKRTGISERIEDLLPFVACIRRHLQVVTGVTVDVRAFGKLPEQYFQTYGRDPVYIAFARALLRVVDFTPDHDKISFTCDDDQETATTLFRLYRRIKQVWPDARKKLVAITFADDRVLFGLQAADLVAGILRLEAGRRMLRKKYDYIPLWKALFNQTPQSNERIWEASVAFADRATLIGHAKSLSAERKAAKRAKQKNTVNMRTLTELRARY